MKIKKITGEITRINNLSATAKEVFVRLSEPTDFIAGSFFNVFININGERVRRAFSISSSQADQTNVSFTIRLSPAGTMTPIFWDKNMAGETIELMGPLGLNTVDKMTQNKVYLFAFGVGTGVVKSIADYFSRQRNIQSLTIFTGSKTEDEILHKDYFDELSKQSEAISVTHVVSRPKDNSNLPKGYIQDHIESLNFSNSDVYVCGQESACNELVEKIKSIQPTDTNYFIEGFH